MADGVTHVTGVDETTRLVEAWCTAVDAPPECRVHGGVSPSQYRTWSELRLARDLSRHVARRGMRVDAACMHAMERALGMFVSRKARDVMRAAMHRVRAPDRKQRRREDREDRKDHGKESALAALALTVPLGEGKWTKWLPPTPTML